MPDLLLATQVLAVVGLGTVLVALPAITVLRVVRDRARSRRAAELAAALDALVAACWSAGSRQEMLDAAQAACCAVLALEPTHVRVELVRGGEARGRVAITVDRRLDAGEQRFVQEVRRAATDAVERHSLSARLAEIGSTDPLTSLPNLTALERHLRRCLARAAAVGAPVAVIASDAVDLTSVNDRWGRAVGDRALVALGELAVDVSPQGTFVARTGGDQFVLVLDDPADETLILDLARRVRRGVPVPGAPGATLVSRVGVVVREPQPDAERGEVSGAEADTEADAAERLLRDVALALGLARTSPAGLVVYEERLRVRAEEARRGAAELERAVQDGEIVAVFQPQVDSRTLAVVGLEALARWRRDGSLVAPGQWIDLAEQTGLVVPLGLEVLRQARAAHDRWGLPVSVNVAAAQLESPGFVDDARRIWGADRWEHLTIEVTESTSIFDSLHVRAALIELSSLGARIAIDDFGTGYNSLARLGQLPLDELKIDRSFVEAVTTEEGAAVVRAVVGLARALALDVVAEGVERPEQLAALHALGIGTVQGFMVGRPRADVGDVVDRPRGPRPRSSRRRAYLPQVAAETAIAETVLPSPRSVSPAASA